MDFPRVDGWEITEIIGHAWIYVYIYMHTWKARKLGESFLVFIIFINIHAYIYIYPVCPTPKPSDPSAWWILSYFLPGTPGTTGTWRS